MKKKYIGLILGVAFLKAVMVVTADGAATEVVPVLSEKHIYTITADYSALDLTEQDFSTVSELRAFSDAACEHELDLEIVSSENEKITYQFEQEMVLETIYLIPPIISVSEKVEEEMLNVEKESDDYSEEFFAKALFVQKMYEFGSKDRDAYEVNVLITSDTGRYPDNLKMISGGKTYQSKRRISISESDTEKAISEYSFQFEVSDNESTAQKILDNAYFTYSWIAHFEVADNWAYFCKDVGLQIENTKFDWKE